MSSSGLVDLECQLKTILSNTDKVTLDVSKTCSKVNVRRKYSSPHVNVYLLRLQRVGLLLVDIYWF